MASKPTLHYFDVNGRGEVSKMVAAVGGLDIDIVEYPFKANGASAADKLKAGKLESEHPKAATAMGMEGCAQMGAIAVRMCAEKASEAAVA